MGRPDLPGDPQFATLADRVKHADEVNAIVAGWTGGHTAAEVEAAAIAHGVPVANAYTAADIAADAHMAARADLVAVDDPVLGPLRQQAPFPRFAGEPSPAPAGAPLLGEHTRDVLGGILGLSDAELDELAADGVI
jgi:crotonobetainyl-CoA:carnitine CoA-transferase CaiB-like acyl-CoA transferase